jgi:predicted N-acetyltransferase YhbS
LNNHTPIIEVRPIKPEEKAAVDLCIDLSFSKSKEEISHQGFFRQMNYLPLRKQEFEWAVFVDHEPVAAVMLVPFHIQIGVACFHLVGLTGVGTHPDHRHRGYSTKLLQNVHQYLKQEGYHGVVLHSGADELYLKNGYEPCFGALTGIIQQQHFKEILNIKNPSFTTEFLMGSDITENLFLQLWSIRNQDPFFCQRAVKIQRGLTYFSTKLKEQIESGKMLAIVKHKNKIIGYATAHLGKILSITEQYCLLSPAESRLQFVMQLWGDILKQFEPLPTALEINIFYEDSIIREIFRQFDEKIEWRYMTGNMALFFDSFLILNQMQSTFCLRLEASPFMNFIGTFRFHIEGKEPQHIDLHISRGEVTCILLQDEKSSILPIYPLIWEGTITKREFTLIIFGFEEIFDVLDEDKMHGDAIAKEILPIIFPKQYPIWDYGDPY